MSQIRTGQITTASEAWAAFIPSVIPQAGTFSNVTAAGRYTQIGKTIIGQVTITMTNIGTASGQPSFALPVTARSGTQMLIGFGRENAVNGKMVQVFISSGSNTTAGLFYYDNTNPLANGLSLLLNFNYEAA